MTLIVFQIYSNMNIAIVIKWKLNRLIKNEWIGMDDILMEPVDGFTSKLNASFFCNEMNSNN
ncbi:hypothetical protein OAB88_06430 [Winogradskyella sp.]|nr:hypothetical protein [Winogradskyella sp.]MDC1505763.1 hypothetical protein [Winogradskyella sp.]